MKILLLSPPLNSLTHPYSSLPALTGFLRARGEEVVQCDLGIEVMDELLSPQGIESLLQRIRRQEAALSPEEAQSGRGKQLREALLYGSVVAEGIEGAKGVMRGEAFYDPERYLRAHRLVSRGFNLVEAAHPGLRFYGDTLSPCQSATTFDSLEAFVVDPESHPFDAAFSRRLTGLVGGTPFDWIGISITYRGQLYFAAALARMAREILPGVPIVMGGAAIHLAQETLRRFPERAFALADAFAVGGGQEVLGNLLDLARNPQAVGGIHQHLLLSPALRARLALPDDVPTIDPPVDLDAMATPDYEGLNLPLYLVPEPVFLLSNTRTCYYGKCAFCSCGYGHKGRYAIRSMAKIEQDLRTLKERFNARFLFFTDDCLPPKRGKEIAEFLNGSDLDYAWSAWLRYEKSFDDEMVAAMVAGGLRQAAFGNESGSSQMLETMRKGTEPERGAETIRRMAAFDVGIDLQNFIGFPGETEAQAVETVAFLASLKSMVTTCAFGSYFIAAGSPVALDPAAFGVSGLRLSNPELLFPAYRYEVERGTDPKDLPDLHKRLLGFVVMSLPLDSFFLERGVGAHTLLYHARHGASWVCSRLRPLLQRGGQWKPGGGWQWGEGVRWSLHDDGTLSVFDPRSGVTLEIEEGRGCLTVLEWGGDDLPAAGVLRDLNRLYREGLIDRAGAISSKGAALP